MKILQIHNFYQQPGGEDQVFADERALLGAHGHEVVYYTVHNDEVKEISRSALARATVWNGEQYRTLKALVRAVAPQVVHVHNTFPLISPAVYSAASVDGAAVVQTLHNYRLSCVNGLFYRDGHVCEDCLGKAIPWPGVVHACYRSNRVASGVVAAMLGWHKIRGTYRNEVDEYIALTNFSRRKFIEMGLPAGNLAVKPNFVAPDPGPALGAGGYALFVGRIAEEKGVSTLLGAWRSLGGRLPLKIVGDGPLIEMVRSAEGQTTGIEWLGRKTSAEVYSLMGDAACLIFPSVCYETFGRVAVEAFAKGTPVIGSKIGAIAELIEHGRTGLHFEPGNADDLVEQVGWILAHPQELAQMRLEARAEYETKYTPDVNYRLLMSIYDRALSVRRRR